MRRLIIKALFIAYTAISMTATASAFSIADGVRGLSSAAGVLYACSQEVRVLNRFNFWLIVMQRELQSTTLVGPAKEAFVRGQLELKLYSFRDGAEAWTRYPCDNEAAIKALRETFETEMARAGVP